MSVVESPDKYFPRSPIDLPERKVGKVAISHRYQTCFDVVSMREALLTGKRPLRVTFDKPIRIHQLLESGNVWMTDLPIELRQMGDAVKDMQPSGRVLVGGLGLGIVATMIANDSHVESVDVIEISRDVIRLVKPTLSPQIRVIRSDVFAFVDSLKTWSYDCAFFDTWHGTGEGEWWETVFPLRRMIANKFGRQRVICWAEDIMLGQVIGAMSARTLRMFGDRKMLKQWRPHWYYRTEKPMTKRAAEWFVRNVGLPTWEKKYGALYPIEARKAKR